MNGLDTALSYAARSAKFSGVGDAFSMQVAGQGDWPLQQQGVPTGAWLKALLSATGYNITDATVDMIANDQNAPYVGPRYSFWFKVDDELGTGSVQDAFNQLSAIVTPYFNNYTVAVTASNVTPLGGGGVGGGGTITPGGIKTTPGTTPKKGTFQTIADDLKIPLAALGIIGVALVVFFEGRKR